MAHLRFKADRSYLRDMLEQSDTDVDYAADVPGSQHTDRWSENETTSVDDVAAASKTGAAGKTGLPKGARHADEDYNYVRRTIAKEKPLPPITLRTLHKNVNWVSFFALTLVPALSFYGAATTQLRWQTAVWSVVYYFYTGLGITAGYHRLWAHRAYSASLPLQFFLMLGGSGAVEGSIRWWSRGHRAHHRYTDTELDPYSAHKGFWWSHIGWMILKGRRQPGVADVSDLTRNPVVKFQHKYYLWTLATMGFIVPMAVAGFCWGDWRGGFYFAGAARLLFVHHSTFCVNSLAHWLGEAPFDDKHTPRDHFITALVTVGEGYHNFHHQFPADYRNAIKWYQYDPTKWFVWTAYKLGLASNLKTFPDNEVQKGMYNMELKKLERKGAAIVWAKDSNDLPVLSWDEYQEQVKSSGRLLTVVGGFIIDVTTFIDEHPGGRALVKGKIGKDASTSFNGGVYDHSNAAHNLTSMLRVGVLDGGVEVESLKMQPGMTVFDGPSLRTEAAKKLSKVEKSKKQRTERALPLPLTIKA